MKTYKRIVNDDEEAAQQRKKLGESIRSLADIATAKSKNPDGTFNGVKLLSILSGLSEDEVRKEWEKAKARKEMERRN